MSNNKQIGWSVDTNLLSTISKKLDKIIKIAGRNIVASTTTTTTTTP